MPAYINYNQGLYNKGNYNQRLAEVIAAVSTPSSTVFSNLVRFRLYDGVVDADATTAADILRIQHVDGAVDVDSTISIADFIQFATMSASTSAGTTVTISPKATFAGVAEISGAATVSPTFTRIQHANARTLAECLIVPVISYKLGLFDGTVSASATLTSAPREFWEPEAGKAVIFVDGSQGAGVWANITITDGQYSNVSATSPVYTEKTATQVTYG